MTARVRRKTAASTVGLAAEYTRKNTNRRVFFWLYFGIRLPKSREFGSKRGVQGLESQFLEVYSVDETFTEEEGSSLRVSWLVTTSERRHANVPAIGDTWAASNGVRGAPSSGPRGPSQTLPTALLLSALSSSPSLYPSFRVAGSRSGSR